MKNILTVVMVLFAIVAHALEYTADAKLSDPIVLDGEYEINVASGVTVECSGTISGAGSIYKTGAGTLVLSGSANTFSGGLRIAQGYVRVDNQGAIGAGDILIDDSAGIVDTKRGQNRQICFNAQGGIFANAITISGYSPASSSLESSFIYAPVDTTLNGKITFSGSSSSWTTACICSKAGCTLTINGEVSW